MCVSVRVGFEFKNWSNLAVLEFETFVVSILCKVLFYSTKSDDKLFVAWSSLFSFIIHLNGNEMPT